MKTDNLIKRTILFNWAKYPIVLPCVAFIIGILISNSFNTLPFYLWIPCIFLLPLIYYLEQNFYSHFRANDIKFIPVFIVFVLLGWLRNEIEKPTWQQNHILGLVNFEFKHLKGKGVITHIEQNEKGFKYDIDVENFCQDSCYIIGTKTILYNYSNVKFSILDRIEFTGSLLPKRPPNFNAFDYNLYLERKGINFTVYTDNDKAISKIGTAKSNIRYWDVNAREYVLSTLRRYIDDPIILSLNSAMLTGDRSNLEDETVRLFSQTGAIHVLAVSGLHVGILLHFFYMILGLFFKKHKLVTNKLVIFISIILCFMFCVFVGASPSVLRAALLFSIMALIRSTNNTVSPYNVLATTAIILLMYNPTQLSSLSFQFSFAAILSLVMFGSYVDSLFTSKSRTLNQLWKLISVSISVQVLMAPLIVYYFGFYSTWFFLNGIVAIPMAYSGLIGSAALVLFDSISSNMATWIALSYTGFMKICYLGLELITLLPFDIIENIYINTLQLVIILVIIILLYIFIIRKEIKILYYANLVLALLSLNLFFSSYLSFEKKEVIFYSVSKGFLVDVFDGNKVFCINTSGLDSLTIKYSTSGYRRKKQANFVSQYSLKDEIKNDNFRFVNGLLIARYKKIYFLKSFDSTPLTNFDVVVVGREVDLSLLESLKSYKGVIVLSNDARWKVKQSLREGKYEYTLIDIGDGGSFPIEY